MSLLQRQNSAMQIPYEIEQLQSQVSILQPKIIVEIGTSIGGTIGRWLQIKNVETVISLDMISGIHGGTDENNKRQLIKECNEYAINNNVKFYHLEYSSHEENTKKYLEKILNSRLIDALFIDGDHGYDGVYKDFEMYSSFVRENGIIAFHDIINSQFHHINNCYVDTLWNKLKQYFPHKEFIDTKNGMPYMPHAYENNGGGFGGVGVLDYNKKSRDEFIKDQSLNKTSTIIIGCCDKDLNQYNNTTKKCIDSIYNSFNDNILQINVICNGASKEVIDALNNEYIGNKKEVTIFQYEDKLGFSKAYNEGMKYAHEDSNYFILLNNDTIPFGDWYESLLQPFYNNKDVGITSPAIRDDGCLLGFCLAIKKEILNKTGILNESFKLGYYEDDEFTIRVRNAGYKAIGISKVENGGINFHMHHVGMQTFLQIDNVNELIEKNKEKFNYYKNNRNICYAIIPNSVEYLFEQLNKLYIDSVTLICIINIYKLDLNEYYDQLRIFDNYIHIIEPYNKISIADGKDLAKAFFGKEESILYVQNKINNIDLTWLACFNDHASMGILSQNIIESLSENVNIKCKNIIADIDTKNSLIQYLNYKKEDEKNIGLMFSYPGYINELNDYNLKCIYTGCDTNIPYYEFFEQCNKADIVFTPSLLSKSFMIGGGITKPIFVFPHGVNTNVFKYVEREFNTINNIDDTFVFLYCGECSDRKGTFQLLEAFNKIVKNNNVKLILKSNEDVEHEASIKIKNYIVNNGLEKNVEYIRKNESQEKIFELMSKSHCYVYPSRADSFGMTVIEAMATGLPIIMNEKLGCEENIKGRYFKIKSEQVNVSGHPFLCGDWSESDVDDLSKKMLYVKNNFNLLKEANKNNSDYIHNEYSWKNVTERFENILQILNNNVKKKTITTFITSFNRIDYLKQTLESLYIQKIQDKEYNYKICIFEQSDKDKQKEIVSILENNYKHVYDELYVSDINFGQRAALNRAFELKWFDNADYIMLTDQDNVFYKPLSMYAKILNKYPQYIIATGYLSKEHSNDGIIFDKEYGTLIEKTVCRAGHMFYRKNDLEKMIPLPLEKFERFQNPSWRIGLDWTLLSWHKKSPLYNGITKYIVCIPNSVEHIGYDSTWRYSNEEIIKREEIDQFKQFNISQEQDLEIINKI
jgi:glycosyltransferase involved in cell wall biosynthesis/GT2 family glycosyltransferase